MPVNYRTAAPEHALNPATRLLWRPDGTLQLELGGRALVVDGPAAQAVRALTRTPADTRRNGGRRRRAGQPDAGPPPPGARAALRALAEAGYLWPAAPADAEARPVPPSPRLAAELRALGVRHGPAAADVLTARRHLSVVVQGANRSGSLAAALLAAAGIGRVHVREPRAARLWQTVPGGVAPDDEGLPFCAAANDAVMRAAPDTDTRPPDERPDLVLLAYDEPLDPDRRDALHDTGQVHLALRLAGDHGVVGPLVIPGLTSCLRCADLHRLDRDPAWSALAVQLSVPTPTGSATPAALAGLVAAIAAEQALAYLDGEQPAVIDGTLEQHLPDWRIRRRSWPAHPDCDCTGPG